jgi:hypothetical protein
MRHSETVGAIASALAKAQKQIEGAAKDSKNPHFNSRYADLASIVDACRGPLADNGLAIIQSPSTDAQLVRMTTLLLHSSGEWIESDPLTVQVRDAAPQAVGSGITYLRRYQLAAVCGVAPDDDDAEAAEGRTAKAPAAKASAPSPSAEKIPSSPNGGDSGRPLTVGEIGPIGVAKVGVGKAGAVAEITLVGREPALTFKDAISLTAQKALAEGRQVMVTVKRSSSGNLRIEGMTAQQIEATKFEHATPITADEIPF